MLACSWVRCSVQGIDISRKTLGTKSLPLPTPRVSDIPTERERFQTLPDVQFLEVYFKREGFGNCLGLSY